MIWTTKNTPRNTVVTDLYGNEVPLVTEFDDVTKKITCMSKSVNGKLLCYLREDDGLRDLIAISFILPGAKLTEKKVLNDDVI